MPSGYIEGLIEEQIETRQDGKTDAPPQGQCLGRHRCLSELRSREIQAQAKAIRQNASLFGGLPTKRMLTLQGCRKSGISTTRSCEAADGG